MSASTFNVIQTLLWPENGVATEIDLFMRPAGPVAVSYSERRVIFESGGQLDFNTAENLFNVTKWNRHCGDTDLHFRLRGNGRFELRIKQFFAERSAEYLFNDLIQLVEGEDYRLDLTPMMALTPGGVLTFRLVALESASFSDAVWETTEQPKRQPQLALSITTFKREQAVQATVARFETFITRSAIEHYLHMIVVDNGASAEIAPTKNVTLILNRNLGGSGGFARGLLAAEERQATHCLFMDDDASIPMEAIERTWAFLAYSLDTRLAISGGMTMANYRWAVWESGAVFDRVCRPQWLGTDLRDFGQVLKMEFGSVGPKPHNFYGGWWFFAFPIGQVARRPFPFFIRGDDISFSIANDFEIATLPGVMCFQDADFSDKESSLTLYLDLRSHLVHHLALPKLNIGRLQLLTIPARFFVRAMMQNHLDTMSALILAVKDVLDGPKFFADNADMAKRRDDLAAMRTVEAWQPLTGPMPPSRRRFDPRGSRVLRTIMKYSLNGYLLPFFSIWGNSVTLSANKRGALNEVWGAARVTYINGDGTQSFTVRHSKLSALWKGAQMTVLMLKLALKYTDIRASWRKGYHELTTRENWEKILGLNVGTSKRS